MHSPQGPGQRTSQNEFGVRTVKYNIGAPKAYIPQNNTDFRDEPTATTPGTRKSIKNIEKQVGPLF